MAHAKKLSLSALNYMKMSTEAAPWKHVRPLMSRDVCEARRRAIGLYRACFRYIPYIVKYHHIPKNEEDVRWKIREKFYKNSCVRDTRVVDLLVMKGYMELAEVKYQWQQKGHVMANWNPTAEPQPCDFVGKFLKGQD